MSSSETRPIASPAGFVVVGGANVDIKLQAATALRRDTSTPGAAQISLGGVARNIAANLAQLGASVTLLTAVGDDEFGRRITREAQSCGIDSGHVVVGDAPTGVYGAILDRRGRLVAGVSSMSAIDAITPDEVDRKSGVISGALAVVCDCNLSPASILRVGRVAAAAGVEIFVEGVSTEKVLSARRLLSSDVELSGMFLNRDEIEALTGLPARGRRQLVAAADELHRLAVTHVAVGLGARGVFVSSGGSREILASMAERVADVTGAGDASVAGTVWALGRGDGFFDAVRSGQAAAALTIASRETVSPAVSPVALNRLLARSLE